MATDSLTTLPAASQRAETIRPNSTVLRMDAPIPMERVYWTPIVDPNKPAFYEVGCWSRSRVLPLWKMDLLLNGVLMETIVITREDFELEEYIQHDKYPKSGACLELTQEQEAALLATYPPGATLEKYRHVYATVSGGDHAMFFHYMISWPEILPQAMDTSEQAMALRFDTSVPNRLRLLWLGKVIRDWDITGL